MIASAGVNIIFAMPGVETSSKMVIGIEMIIKKSIEFKTKASASASAPK